MSHPTAKICRFFRQLYSFYYKYLFLRPHPFYYGKFYHNYSTVQEIHNTLIQFHTRGTGRRGSIFPEGHQWLSRLSLTGWRSLLGSLRRSDCAFLDAIASSRVKFGLVSLRFGYPVPSLIWVPVVSSLLVVPRCFCRAWLKFLKAFYLHLISIWDTIRENKLSPWVEFLRTKPKGTLIKHLNFLVMSRVTHIEKALQAGHFPYISLASEGGEG